MKVFDYDNLILGEKVFGLEVKDNIIKALELTKRRGRFSVVGFGEQEFDPTAISEGVIVNKDLLADVIKSVRDQAKPRRIRSKYASVVLPDSKIYVRVVKFPAGMSKDEIRESIEWKAKDLIAMPLDKVYWDWHRLQANGDPSRNIEVEISAVDKECVDSYTQTLKMIGVTPLYYDISGNAAARFLFQNEYKEKKALLVRIDKYSTTLSLFLNGGVRYQTVIKDVVKGGYNSLIDYTAGKLGVNKEQAERIILNPENINNDQKKALKESFNVNYGGLYQEIDQIMDFYSQTLNHIHSSSKLNKKGKKELDSNAKVKPVKQSKTGDMRDKVDKDKEIPVKELQETSSNDTLGPQDDGITEQKNNKQKDDIKEKLDKKSLNGQSKDFGGIYLYGRGAQLFYIREYFKDRSIEIKAGPEMKTSVSPMLPFISRQSLPENLVLLGLALRNLGLFRDLRDINLVPKLIKKKYLKVSIYSSLYTYLRIIFWNVFIIGIALACSFMISLIYKSNVEKELASVENIAESKANKELRNQITYINSTAVQLSNLLDTQADWGSFFQQLSQKQGDSIVYSNILVSEDPEAWQTLSKESKVVEKSGYIYLVVSGIADTREDLLVFLQDLERSDIFEDVRMPISNYESSENIEFTIYCLVKTSELTE